MGDHDTIVHQTPYYTARQESNRLVVQLSGGHIATDADASHHPSLALEATATQIKSFQVAEDKGMKLWKEKLGAYAAHHIVRPAVVAEGRQWTADAKSAVLLAFPEGYQLFTRTRGDRSTKDRYLYGSRNVNVFRSPEEFALHLGWLMTGRSAGAHGRPGCRCCHCDPSVKQREIRQRCDHLRLAERRVDNSRNRGKLRKRARSTTSAAGHSEIRYKDYSKLGDAGSSSGRAGTFQPQSDPN